jgi:hypothetical protein
MIFVGMLRLEKWTLLPILTSNARSVYRSSAIATYIAKGVWTSTNMITTFVFHVIRKAGSIHDMLVVRKMPKGSASAQRQQNFVPTVDCVQFTAHVYAMPTSYTTTDFTLTVLIHSLWQTARVGVSLNLKTNKIRECKQLYIRLFLSLYN